MSTHKKILKCWQNQNKTANISQHYTFSLTGIRTPRLTSGRDLNFVSKLIWSWIICVLLHNIQCLVGDQFSFRPTLLSWGFLFWLLLVYVSIMIIMVTNIRSHSAICRVINVPLRCKLFFKKVWRKYEK